MGAQKRSGRLPRTSGGTQAQIRVLSITRTVAPPVGRGRMVSPASRAGRDQREPRLPLFPLLYSLDNARGTVSLAFTTLPNLLADFWRHVDARGN